VTIQRILFQSIPIADQDRALAFYTEMLGFEVHTDAPYGENWRWIFLTLPGAETRLHFAQHQDIQVNDKPALCLVTDDVDKECARLKEAGVIITNGPDDAPWANGVRWATLRDTEDNIILLESFHG
jgi:catechol 2,3-dioxygenase-like lactoylglutathione lyase family enzyme